MPQFHSSGLLTADGSIKSGNCRLRQITLAYKGVTAGEFCTLIDGTDITGSDEVMIVFPAANGTIDIYFGEEGKEFYTGCFFNKGATTGSVWCAADYR